MNLKRGNWIHGYLELQIRGKYVERLINRMVGQGMQVWDITRKENEAYFCITLDDFHKMKPLLKETDCRLHVAKRVGLPFFLKKIGTRSLFLVGIVLFFIGIYFLSSVVWRVDIVGNEKIPTSEIRQVAEQIGIKQGIFKFRLPQVEKIQKDLLNKIPRASWVGFEMKGTTAIIKVAEKVVPDPKRAENKPVNIIASKKAVIYYIFTEKGNQLVLPNDVVKKGQILISGIYGNEENSKVDTARGIVEGEVWYESEISVPLKQNRPVLTGDNYTEKYLTIGNFTMKISGFFQKPFSHAVRSEENSTLSWTKSFLPIGLKTVTFREDAVHETVINQQEASSIGKKLARENLLKGLGASARIKEENVLQERLENGKVYIKIHYVVIENIAQEQAIDTNPIQTPNPTNN